MTIETQRVLGLALLHHPHTLWSCFMLRVDSIEGMTSQVPSLRKKFVQDADYFKKVYKYVFDLGKQEGAKVVGEFPDRIA